MNGSLFLDERQPEKEFARCRVYLELGRYPKDPAVLKILRRSKFTMHSKFTMAQ